MGGCFVSLENPTINARSHKRTWGEMEEESVKNSVVAEAAAPRHGIWTDDEAVEACDGEPVPVTAMSTIERIWSARRRGGARTRLARCGCCGR